MAEGFLTLGAIFDSLSIKVLDLPTSGVKKKKPCVFTGFFY